MISLLESLDKHPKNKKVLKSLPETSGIYVFWGNGMPIYIGKAKNLKNRVKSYFTATLGRKTKEMVHEAKSFSYSLVVSELEALLLEGELIRLNKPKYNSALKDDKHPLYITVSKEYYPRVLTARKQDLVKDAFVVGPFPSSYVVRGVLKMIRRIIPYSDHKIGKKPCLYSQFGECNPCPSQIEGLSDPKLKSEERRKYLGNISKIKKILSRKFLLVKGLLTKEIKTLSDNEKYEEAAVVHKKLAMLEYITQPITPTQDFLENPNLYEDIRNEEIVSLWKILKYFIPDVQKPIKIECYDIAHLGGVNAAASMVTFDNAQPDKKLYRHFRLRKQKVGDTKSLEEIGRRRVKHFKDWGKPDLIIVDGGRGQVSTFYTIFSTFNIPVVGIAKGEEKLVFKSIDGFKEYKLGQTKAKNLVQRIRDEAHRFARRYHHHLVKSNLFDTHR